MLAQEDSSVFPALAHAFTGITNPGAGLFQNAFIHAQVDQVALARDAFAIKNIEFGFAERRGHFVLHDFGAGTRADHSIAFVDGLNAANIDAHRSVELQCAVRGGGFRIAEHHANLFADLVDEDQAGLGFGNDGGEFAQRLRHQARLQAHGGIAHVAFELGLGDQSGDGVDNNDVDGARADERFGDFESLFTVIGLRHQQIVNINAQTTRIAGIERVLGVDESGLAAELLRFSDHLQSERGFTAGFRAIDFNHAAARKTANTESGVNLEAATGDDVDRNKNILVAEAYDGTFAVGLFNL